MSRGIPQALFIAVLLLAAMNPWISSQSIDGSKQSLLLPTCSAIKGFWMMGSEAVLMRGDGALEALSLLNSSILWIIPGVRNAVRAGEVLIAIGPSGMKAVAPSGKTAWSDEGFREASRNLSSSGLTPLILKPSPRGSHVAVLYAWGKGLVNLGIVAYNAETGGIDASGMLGKYSAVSPTITWLNDTLAYVEIASSPTDVKAFILDASQGWVKAIALPREFASAVPRSAALMDGRIVVLSLAGSRVVYSYALTGGLMVVREPRHGINAAPQGLLAPSLTTEGMYLETPLGETYLAGLNTILARMPGMLVVGGATAKGYNVSLVNTTSGAIDASFEVDAPPLSLSRNIIVTRTGSVYLHGERIGSLPVHPGSLISFSQSLVAAAYSSVSEWSLGQTRYRGCRGYIAYMDLKAPASLHVLPLVGRGTPLVKGLGIIGFTQGSSLQAYLPGGSTTKIDLGGELKGPVRVVSTCPNGACLVVLSSTGYYLVGLLGGKTEYRRISVGGGIVDYAWSKTCRLAVYTRDGAVRIYSLLKQEASTIWVGQLSWGRIAWGSSGAIYLYGESIGGGEHVLYVINGSRVSHHKLEDAGGKGYIWVISKGKTPSLLIMDNPVSPKWVDIVSMSSGVRETLVKAGGNASRIGLLRQGYVYRFSTTRNNTMMVELWSSSGAPLCNISGSSIPKWINVAGNPPLILVYWAGQGIEAYSLVGGSCIPGRILPGIYPEAFNLGLSTLVASMNSTYQLVSGKLVSTPISDTFIKAWSLGGSIVLLSSPTSSYLWIPGESTAARMSFKAADVVRAGDTVLILGSFHACLINTTLMQSSLRSRAPNPCISEYVARPTGTTTSTPAPTTSTTSTTTTTTSRVETTTPRKTITTIISLPSRNTGVFMQAGIVILVLAVAIAGYILGRKGRS